MPTERVRGFALAACGEEEEEEALAMEKKKPRHSFALNETSGNVPMLELQARL